MLARTFLKIFIFVLVVVGIYAYVGQLVPQFEEHPPKTRTITAETDRDELSDIGQELLRGKGGCLICHKDSETGNTRGPDLRQSAATAASRKPGLDAEAYLLESLREPGAFLVPGYPNMMPSALKPPANLTPAEIKAVVAYLQVLGGAESTAVVTVEDVEQSKRVAKGDHRGRTLMDQHGCTACHKVEDEGGEIAPDLTGAGARFEPDAILRKLNDPAAWTTPNFEEGLMPSFAEAPPGDLHEIVAYLSGLAGKSYNPTGAASPWSHEGVRLGLVIFIANGLMLVALAWARRRERREAAQ
ncbi:MAG: cytochrome c [Alphaproteobacteria bacterium]|nr:cytochrome c [Alphaproteobacteria bacterium]